MTHGRRWPHAAPIAFVWAVSVALATPLRATPCTECFAVVIVPDTQDYVRPEFQPAGGNHLDLIGRFLCENRTDWVEKETGKEMPIEMLVHTGDLVQNGGDPAQWQLVSDAFAHLDACDPPLPYTVTLGNHDYDSPGRYQMTTEGFEEHFGVDRWAAHQCTDPANCLYAAGEWFIGDGDPILAHTRNLDEDTGPEVDQAGRHRGVVIRAPRGRRFLFLGLELAFDFPPAAHPGEGDDSAWPKQVLDDYAGVPTIVVHHSLFRTSGLMGHKNWESDSFATMQGLWNEMIEPYPQILMTINGHYLGSREEEWEISRLIAPNVFAVFRNYQSLDSSYGDGGEIDEGDGWTVFMVFDPGEEEIRIHSYRIEDLDDDGTHDGVPRSPQELDADFNGRPPTVFNYEFPDAWPASFDNCPEVSNPNQRDTNRDGVGDACTGPSPVPVIGFSRLVSLALLLAGIGTGLIRSRQRRTSTPRPE
jgi:hypothetical protein